MCGRLTLRHSERIDWQGLGIGAAPELACSYNIAPGSAVPIIRQGRTGREEVMLRWGLLPHWSEDPTLGFINGRSETAAVARPFKYAFRYRRCLILADGFYVWKATGGKKQPYFIRMKNDRPFAIAGVWERWWKNGHGVESCALLTTSANKALATVHERMPALIRPQDHALWLHPELRDVGRIKKLIRRCPGSAMQIYAVSTLVNSPRNNTPRCIEVAEEAESEALLFT